jgi:hypothetical protein
MQVWDGLGTIVPVPPQIRANFCWIITHTRTHNVSFYPTHCEYFLWVTMGMNQIVIPVCHF